MKNNDINSNKIMQVGMGYWPSKILLVAVNLGLFTYLAQQELSGKAIKNKLKLNERSLYDFLDTLVALGFLKRKGLKETALYSNTEESNLFLDKNKPGYVGGMLEMSNNRLYAFWNDLEEGLKTGLPQNELKTGEKTFFEKLYANEEKLREFIKAMGEMQMGNFIAFVNKFDFSNYSTLCDIGGAGAYLSAQVSLKNGNMKCVSFDLPPICPIATENINQMGLTDKVFIKSGNFLKEDFPKADVITMGNILHYWGLHNKKMLIKKAFEALPKGGALVVIEDMIDDNRKEKAFSLMMSLNVKIETPEGFNFSAKDFDGWTKEIGFLRTSEIPLTGSTSAIIAIK